jgi:hypothetical protein
MKGKSFYDFPIHLGLGAKAVSEPQFDAESPAVALFITVGKDTAHKPR